MISNEQAKEIRERCQITGDLGTRWIDDEIVIKGITTKEKIDKGLSFRYWYKRK